MPDVDAERQSLELQKLRAEVGHLELEARIRARPWWRKAVTLTPVLAIVGVLLGLQEYRSNERQRRLEYARTQVLQLFDVELELARELNPGRSGNLQPAPGPALKSDPPQQPVSPTDRALDEDQRTLNNKRQVLLSAAQSALSALGADAEPQLFAAVGLRLLREGMNAEAETFLTRALDGSLATTLRFDVLRGLARAQSNQGSHARSSERWEEALQLIRAPGDAYRTFLYVDALIERAASTAPADQCQRHLAEARQVVREATGAIEYEPLLIERLDNVPCTPQGPP
jgi:tetratricopeptide (TPR) repeat protein